MPRRPGRRGRRRIVIDANILLLIVVGGYDTALISRFKRTARYNANDYALVNRQLAAHQPRATIFTTPHVLAEVSNLLGQLQDPARTHCRQILGALVARVSEHAESARALVNRPCFPRLGITDAAIDQLADSNTTIMTDDFELGGLLQDRAEVWNLRQMRSWV